MKRPSESGEDPFYQVELHGCGAIVRRTTRRYLELADVPRSFADVDADLSKLAPDADTLLVDLRAAVGRNDPEFEAVLTPLRRELLRRFARRALLVRSGIGRLQLQRYLAADGIDALVFSDEGEARSWFERPT